MINWNNKASFISKYFTVKEATYLNTTQEFYNPTNEEKNNLINLFNKMDLVRGWINKPIIVHCAIRPIEYNKLIGGAKNSLHIKGLACDFHVLNMDCDEVRKKIIKENMLEKWEMRCEDLEGSNWIHLDNSKVIRKRYFKP